MLVRTKGNNIYVSKITRERLEKLAVEAGFKKGRIISASKFVDFLINNYGEVAKDAFINSEE